MGKTLRFIGILFLSISALFNIAGGAGTTCVAINPTKYEGFEAIANAQWLYFIFVIGTLAFGIMMVRAVVLLVQGRTNGYRYAMIALVSATLIGIVHVITSRSLRGGSMPVDGVVYATVLTLILFLLFRIPGIWEQVDFAKTRQAENDISGGAAAIITGLLSLTIQYWMAPTHTIGQVNYGDAFHLTTSGTGLGLILLGTGLMAGRVFKAILAEKAAQDEMNA